MSRRGTRREYQAGRAPIKVYEYTLEGKFVQTYDCINDYRNKYYAEDAGKRPLFVNTVERIDYDLSPNDTIAFKQRVYRDHIKFYLKIINSMYCNFNKTDTRKVQLYNLKGEVLTEFKNLNVTKHLLSHLISPGTMASQVNQTGPLSKNSSELVVRYKHREND